MFSAAMAQGVLEGLDVDGSGRRPVIHIRLAEPVNYVRHSPAESGDTLRIRVNRTSPAAAQGVVPQPGTLRWPATAEVPLTEVGYETKPGGDFLTLRFNRVVNFQVRPGKDAQGIDVEIAGSGDGDRVGTGDRSLPVPPASGACASGLRVKSPPADLKEAARQCMIKEDWPAAIGLYTKLVQQPDASYQREAQEMLGLARERNGQAFRAKTEYEKYLQRYPEGEAAERVKKRLDALNSADQQPKEKLTPLSSSPVAERGWETYGSFGQYYFRDALLTDNQGEYVDQSLFLTVLDVTSRLRTERFDIRTQFDARYRQNFLKVVYDENNQFRVANAFIDVVDKATGVSGRIGRQSRSSGGAMGRFDGGVLSYRFAPQWQATVIGGFPVLPYRSTAPNTNTSFEGASLEFGPFADYWAGNVFFINQTVDGLLGRRAVGGEGRYQHPVHPLFTLFDYDVHFNALNTAQVVANWNFDNGAILTLTADYRKTPYLSTSNALIGWGSGYGPGTGYGADSVGDILRYQDTIDLKTLAEDNTPTFKYLSISGMTPITPDTQINADITVSNLSATKGSPWVSAYQGSGTQVSYFGQVITNRLITDNDVWNFGLRYMTQQIDDILSGFVDAHYPVTPDIRIDPRLRVDYFTGFDGPDVWRVRPGTRFNYRVVDGLYFELEGGFEYMTKPLVLNERDTKGYYVNVGYRWDF
ncbi:hypothetical protein GNH96_06425 [Methylococcus geothermalis]|uniref:Uncharacterized protein n=1 Tax=Methylococcus geothermalis TaxID=2681310 RepID=A0A858QC21_9GAMM|nr:hypothetical protein GNH96_06425 [Methylococcus geothermalis]